MSQIHMRTATDFHLRQALASLENERDDVPPHSTYAAAITREMEAIRELLKSLKKRTTALAELS